MLILGLMPCYAVLGQTPGDNGLLTAPRVAASPVIDGRIDPDEWREATVIDGLVAQGTDTPADPNTVAYLAHDARGIYLAFRCEEADPRLPRAFRRAHDDRAFEDDCVQVFVAPEDPSAARAARIGFGGYEGSLDTWYRDIQAYYEFTVNAVGSRTEARNDVRDWTAEWAAAVGREEGAWIVEMAIPAAAFGLERVPDGAVWGLNLFRYRPPRLSGWVCPGFGGYRPLPLGMVQLGGARMDVPCPAPASGRQAPPELSLRYFALPGEVRAEVHLPGPSSATEAQLTLRPTGGDPSAAHIDLREKPGAVLTLPVRGRTGDQFVGHLLVRDASGQTLAEQTLDLAIPEPPSWRETQAGRPLGVLPPWTPIEADGTTVSMLGKRLQYDDFALPASITSAGGELLAGPMRLVVVGDGDEVTWRSREFRLRERAEDHVLVESVWRNPRLTLTATSRVEYDGFTWNEVTLTPTGAVTVDRVALEVPFRRDACRYAYEGHAQAGHALSPLGLRRPIGDNLWLGDEERGIAWLAESLEWVEAQDRARQVEVLPGKARTLWRSTFIDAPTTLTEPYTARFALHVTPAKPVSLRKSRIYHGAFYGMESTPGGLGLTLSGAAALDPGQGAFECWVKPTFDPAETYDPSVDRSQYNRQFLNLRTSADEMLILYYNADDRNFRCIIRKADGTYPVILSAPSPLPAGQWSYLGLSWGEKLRINVNGQAAELPVAGTVVGAVDPQGLRLDLGCFNVDEIRASSRPRPLDGVPDEPFAEDEATLFVNRCEALDEGTVEGGRLIEGRFGQGLGTREETFVERLGREGKRIVIFHENWSRFQGYPDLAQAPKLKAIADACHANGMLFLIYFNQSMSTAAPEWAGFRDDLLAFPMSNHYHRDDIPQDCYTGCVNGPYGELLLAGIERLADEAGIDGVYMDGTTVPWYCENPSHPGCGESLGDGRYRGHVTIRATREFMKRLRSIFAQRRPDFFLDAHTGGCINIATQAFTDGYFDGETLARYKPGFRLAPDVYLTGYMGKQFGVRGDFLPNRHTTDQALAVSLIHDTATRGQPAEVDRALAPYEDSGTRFIGYWERSPLYTVNPPQALGSLYLRPDRALLAIGSQTEAEAEVEVRLGRLLERLPPGCTARDPITGQPVPRARNQVSFPLPARGWKMIELKP